jgi:type IV secretory pathway TraG/TraD family ATPase VirD4
MVNGWHLRVTGPTCGLKGVGCVISGLQDWSQDAASHGVSHDDDRIVDSRVASILESF